MVDGGGVDAVHETAVVVTGGVFEDEEDGHGDGWADEGSAPWNPRATPMAPMTTAREVSPSVRA